MSDLRVILSVAGAVLIVLLFVWYKWQERRLQRRGDATFGSRHDDVLLSASKRHGPVSATDRVEPEMDSPDAGAVRAAEFAALPGALPAATPPASGDDTKLVVEEAGPLAESTDTGGPASRFESAPPIDDRIDAVALISAGAGGAIESAPLLDIDRSAFSKTISCFGDQAGIWGELEPGRSYQRVAMAMQLVDRNGPVPGMEFASFAGQLEQLATRHEWQLELARSESVLQRAAELDRLCIEVDFQITFDVVAAGDKPFPGTRIRGLAEANGLELAADGSFRRVGAGGSVWFTLKNRGATPFSFEHMREFSTRALTLALDAPRAPREAFPALRALLKGLCTALQGIVIDEHGRRLDDAALDLVGDQLRSMHGRLELSGIVPGGALSLRLFS